MQEFGRVELDSEVTGRSEIECGIGELDITLRGNKEDYKIIAEKGIGSIKIEGAEQGNNVSFGSGINTIELEGGIRKRKSRV